MAILEQRKLKFLGAEIRRNPARREGGDFDHLESDLKIETSSSIRDADVSQLFLQPQHTAPLNDRHLTFKAFSGDNKPGTFFIGVIAAVIAWALVTYLPTNPIALFGAVILGLLAGALILSSFSR